MYLVMTVGRLDQCDKNSLSILDKIYFIMPLFLTQKYACNVLNKFYRFHNFNLSKHLFIYLFTIQHSNQKCLCTDYNDKCMNI